MFTTKANLIKLVTDAISINEGGYGKTSLSHKNNNPGNLRSWGSTPIVKGFAKFATPEAGRQALEEQVAKNVFERKLTCLEFFQGQRDKDGNVVAKGYAGFSPAKDGNDPNKYAEFVINYVNKALGNTATRNIKLYQLVQ